MMNEINFLPNSFLREQARQQRVRREAILCFMVAMGIVAWFWSTSNDLEDLERYAVAVEHEATAVQQRINEVTKQQALRKTLRHQVLVQRELVQPLGMTEIIATIAQQTPAAVAVTELSLVSNMPQPAAPTNISKSKSHRSSPRTSAGSRRRYAVHVDDDVMRIDLVGLAPNDRHIADFVGRLADHKLFNTVKLTYTRATQSGRVLAREFHIEMEIPLDRDYRPADDGEVADAS